MKRLINQRGYNLVEIALILTVALMMLSWMTANFTEIQRDQRITETERRIEQIKSAIVVYAQNNRTKPFTVINDASTLTVRWQVSGERPYLPCPDVTGDGLEDRLPLAVVPPDPDRVTLSSGSYAAVRAADCYRYKGVVPWRTLNTSPSDAWGNQFTYRVDPDFAYSLLGFDQDSNPDDSHDLGVSEPPVEVTVLASGRQIVQRTTDAVGDTDITVPTSSSADVASEWGGNITSERAPSLVCDSSPCSHLTAAGALVAGRVAASDTIRPAGGYDFDVPVYTFYREDSIIQGVPIVIVSHGENGHGAVVYDANNDDYRCLPVTSDTHDDELQNAFSNQATANCPMIITSSSDSRQNGFVARPHGDIGTTGGTYDDIVGWMGSEELASRLVQNGTFPVDKLPPVGLDDY